jgi:hypothetical protein
MIQNKESLPERRTTIRKNCMIPVDYVVNRRAYRDFIENISQQGVFIGTKSPVSPGTELVLTFTLKQTGKFIKSSGVVIRKNRKGFAVIFPQPLAIQ